MENNVLNEDIADLFADLFARDLRPYAETIEDAYRIVDMMRERGYDLSLWGDRGKDRVNAWYCRFGKNLNPIGDRYQFEGMAYETTAARAICRAALRAYSTERQTVASTVPSEV